MIYFLLDFILILLIIIFFAKFFKLFFLLDFDFQLLICLDFSLLVKPMSKISQVAGFENEYSLGGHSGFICFV
jgi:hypothetical protein